jgi:nucleotide-binding universal stress UspA family protein
MYHKILIPLALHHGISALALEVASALRSPSGEIHALHVLDTPDEAIGAYLDENVAHAVFETARARLQERLSGRDDVTAVLRKGHTARTIVSYAAEAGVDCIVVGSHKPGLSDYLLGSTAAWVVRHAHCAVHVLRMSV